METAQETLARTRYYFNFTFYNPYSRSHNVNIDCPTISFFAANMKAAKERLRGYEITKSKAHEMVKVTVTDYSNFMQQRERYYGSWKDIPKLKEELKTRVKDGSKDPDTTL